MKFVDVLRGGSSAAVLLAALGLAAYPASAQPAAPAAPDASAADSNEEVVVTGSRIKGTPETAALPVDVISSAELAKQGTPSTVELLKSLPVSNGVLGDSNQFDARSQGTGGVASVNLRGLSPTRTLVLLNSKRLVQVGIGVGVVDVNLIPSAAIGRVEVLKDGAAATYGSDAVAGVVNFITRQGQDGFQASGDYKWIDGSDGDWTLSASYGYQGEDVRVLAALGYQHRSELLALDRDDWALRTYGENPEGGWTSGGNPSAFLPVTGGGTPLGGVRTDASCVPLGGVTVAAGTLAAPAINQRCANQYSAWDALAETEDRWQGYVEASFDVSPDVEIVVSALYGQSVLPESKTSPTYLLTQAPSSAVLPSPNPVSAVSGWFVPSANPGLAAYAAANPGTLPAGSAGVVFPLLLFRPGLLGGNPLFMDGPGDLGSSEARGESTSIRLTADLHWQVNESLNFDASITYHNYERYINGYDSFGDRVELALRGFGGPNCTGTTPGANGCLWYNPFGNAAAGNPASGQVNPGFVPGLANSDEVYRWFFVLSEQTTETELWVFDAALSGGTGLMLDGGELEFSVGGQYRSSSLDTAYAPNNNIAVNPCRETPVNGNLGPCAPNVVGGAGAAGAAAAANGALAFLGTNADVTVDGDVYAFFGELQAPIFETLNLQLAARFEDYGGNVGSTFDPKATLRWEATEWLSFRGSVGTTFRGPPDVQLVPRRVTSLQVIGTSFKPVDVFGNPNLQPEDATNYSVGFVVKEDFITLNVDYWSYEIQGPIVGEPVSGMVNTMFPGGAGAPTVNNCGNPAFAALQARFTFNGACSITNVARLSTNIVNGADVQTSGLDIQLDMFFDVGGGTLTTGGTATYVTEYLVADQTVAGIVVQPGFDASGQLNYQTTAYPVPEWKAQAYLAYAYDIYDARLTMNYIDSYFDQRTSPYVPRVDLLGLVPNAQQLAGQTIDSTFTFDFTFRAEVYEGTTVNFTCINITDEDPSFARLDYNYDPFTGNAYGRQFKFGVTTNF